MKKLTEIIGFVLVLIREYEKRKKIKNHGLTVLPV